LPQLQSFVTVLLKAILVHLSAPPPPRPHATVTTTTLTEQPTAVLSIRLRFSGVLLVVMAIPKDRLDEQLAEIDKAQ